MVVVTVVPSTLNPPPVLSDPPSLQVPVLAVVQLVPGVNATVIVIDFDPRFAYENSVVVALHILTYADT